MRLIELWKEILITASKSASVCLVSRSADVKATSGGSPTTHSISCLSSNFHRPSHVALIILTVLRQRFAPCSLLSSVPFHLSTFRLPKHRAWVRPCARTGPSSCDVLRRRRRGPGRAAPGQCRASTDRERACRRALVEPSRPRDSGTQRTKTERDESLAVR